jgi:drug/metabolite transporter (DMT)-like permease
MIGFLRIVLVMFLWAICFPLITAGSLYAPHMTFAALRAFLAGAALVCLGLALGRPWPRGTRVWITLIGVGLSATSLGYLGMFMGSEFVLPGIATVLANTQPLLAAILAGLVLNERLGRIGWIGMGLGFGGIVVIALPRLLTAQSGNFGLGVTYILMAAIGITISNVLIRSIAGKADPIMAMGAQLLIGGVPLLAGAFAFEDPTSVVWSVNFLLVLAALSLFGSALVYWLWGTILATTELSRANAFSFLVPIFGLAMGAAFFGERLGWFEVAGIGLTLIGIALTNRRGSDNDKAKAEAPRSSGSA